MESAALRTLQKISAAEHLDLPLNYDSVIQAGSMLGTRSIQVSTRQPPSSGPVLRWPEVY